MQTGTAELEGTLTEPNLLVRFPYMAVHASSPHITLQDWVRGLPGRRWDADARAWRVWSLGKDPDRQLADAGIELRRPTTGDLAAVPNLASLYTPQATLDDNNRTVSIHPRLAGTTRTQEFIGGGGVWDKRRKVVRLPVSDILHGASPRIGVTWPEDAVTLARAAHARTPILAPDLAAPGTRLAGALAPGSVADDIRAVQHHLGGPVGTFGVNLYPYQVVGAYGVAAGHSLLADAPGVGKTLSSLAAVTALRTERTVILCPPVVLTNWRRETIRSGYATDDQIVTITPGRKEPVLTDDANVVIVSDSTLAGRPDTAARIAAWLNAASGRVSIVYDEAHRIKSMGSARSDAVLDLAAAVPEARTIALTGTPMLAGPHELVPLLAFTGHLVPVFGGAGPFLERYCRQDRHGGWHPRKPMLRELNERLFEHVWVRRTKDEVLPFLPRRLPIQEVLLDVPLTEYRRAHKDITAEITEWVDAFTEHHHRLPTPAEQEEYAADNLRHCSQLRQAAGVTKAAAALQMIEDHLAAEPDRPLLVWAHHQTVFDALRDGATKLPYTWGVIDGATPQAERDSLVDQFQAGNVNVLFLSITAAGVGITLTRSSDVLFVETDWTPALMLQAIDRAHRIGQERQVSVQVLTALGTLDEHIQAKLAEKGETLSAVLGDTTNSVAAGSAYDTGRDIATPKEIVWGLVQAIVDARTRR